METINTNSKLGEKEREKNEFLSNIFKAVISSRLNISKSSFDSMMVMEWGDAHDDMTDCWNGERKN